MLRGAASRYAADAMVGAPRQARSSSLLSSSWVLLRPSFPCKDLFSFHLARPASASTIHHTNLLSAADPLCSTIRATPTPPPPNTATDHEHPLHRRPRARRPAPRRDAHGPANDGLRQGDPVRRRGPRGDAPRGRSARRCRPGELEVGESCNCNCKQSAMARAQLQLAFGVATRVRAVRLSAQMRDR